MDPELLKLLLAAAGGNNDPLPVAAQDVTSVATPFNRPVPQGEGLPDLTGLMDLLKGAAGGVAGGAAGAAGVIGGAGAATGGALAAAGPALAGTAVVGAKSIKGLINVLKDISFDISLSGRGLESTSPTAIKGISGAETKEAFLKAIEEGAIPRESKESELSRRAFKRRGVIDTPERLVGKGLGFLERGIDDISVAMAETDDLFSLVSEIEGFGRSVLFNTRVSLPGLKKAVKSGAERGLRAMPRPRFVLSQERARDQVISELLNRAQRAPAGSALVSKMTAMIGLDKAPEVASNVFGGLAEQLSNSAKAIDLLLNSVLKKLP